MPARRICVWLVEASVPVTLLTTCAAAPTCVSAQATGANRRPADSAVLAQIPVFADDRIASAIMCLPFDDQRYAAPAPLVATLWGRAGWQAPRRRGPSETAVLSVR